MAVKSRRQAGFKGEQVEGIEGRDSVSLNVCSLSSMETDGISNCVEWRWMGGWVSCSVGGFCFQL